MRTYQTQGLPTWSCWFMHQVTREASLVIMFLYLDLENSDTGALLTFFLLPIKIEIENKKEWMQGTLVEG